jgi:hypothetical protein
MGKIVEEIDSLCIVVHFGNDDVLINFLKDFCFFKHILVINNNSESLESIVSKNISVIESKSNIGIFGAIKSAKTKILEKSKNFSNVFIFNNDLTNICFQNVELDKLKGITFFPVIENNNSFTFGGNYNKILELPIEKKASLIDTKDFNFKKADYFYGAAWGIETKYLELLLDQDFMINFLYFEELYLKNFSNLYNIPYLSYKSLVLSHQKSLSTMEGQDNNFRQMDLFFKSRKIYLKYYKVSKLKIFLSSLFISILFLLKLNFITSRASFINK